MNFPKYLEYKDSGLAWLGEIPKHWGLRKAKYLWREKEERSATGEGLLLSVSQYNGIIPRVEDSRSESLENYKRCEPDDLVTNIMLAWMGGLGISNYDGLVSPAYSVYTLLDNHNPQYLGYLYKTPIYLAEFARRSKGIVPSRWRMYTEDFGQVLTLLPPKEEQDGIVTFLDKITAEIDEAISKKQDLIELLKEQKAILINQAVTKGINPNVPMRDGGGEWVGEMPEHWCIKRLKFITALQSGITLGKSYSGRNLISYPYLRVANVQDGYFKLDDVAELALPKRIAEQYMVRAGDILVTEGGDIDKLGRGTVWNGEIENCLHQNHIFAIRVNREVVDASFISYAMGADCGRRYFTHTANKTTNLASTNSTKLGNFPVMVPPREEQRKIVSWIKGIESEYDHVVDIAMQELSNLRELKICFVAEAVTGKIKI